MDIPFAQMGVELIRQEFENQPPDLQDLTRQRVKRLLTEEALRNPTTESFLMRIAHIYGLGRPKEAKVSKRAKPREGWRI